MNIFKEFGDMNENTQRVILLAGDNAEREAYATILRNRGLEVAITEDGFHAGTILQKEQISSILILSSATQSASRELLRLRALHSPLVPVYFSPPPKPSSLEAALASTGLGVLSHSPHAPNFEALAELDSPVLPEIQPPVRQAQPAVWLPKTEYPILFREARAKFEEEYLRKILKRYRGNVSRVSRAIDMARRNVQLKIKQYGIELSDYREDLDDY